MIFRPSPRTKTDKSFWSTDAEMRSAALLGLARHPDQSISRHQYLSCNPISLGKSTPDSCMIEAAQRCGPGYNDTHGPARRYKVNPPPAPSAIMSFISSTGFFPLCRLASSANKLSNSLPLQPRRSSSRKCAHPLMGRKIRSVYSSLLLQTRKATQLCATCARPPLLLAYLSKLSHIPGVMRQRHGTSRSTARLSL